MSHNKDENKTLLGMSSEEERFDSNTNSPVRQTHLSPQMSSSMMMKNKKKSPTQATEFTTNRVLNAIGGNVVGTGGGSGSGSDSMKMMHHDTSSGSGSGMDDDYNNALELMEMREKKKKKKNKKNNKKWREMTPEERRIKEESEDAKSFFSNERTFLGWIGLTFSLGAIGTAIITFFGTEGVSLGTGLFLWGIAIMFMLYSTVQFRRRGHVVYCFHENMV
ncbi:prespore-specific protein [Heterostelium album PN500]|uniref:Prespore-specific protein n=1 Tax=Heterostelium pallidum (strain ATCC 26659 / Pp 5 / PN500) TaxID=670386 RepID=D3B8D5_HETP5|nr:prespore-specific protein [Heterostelium album PN500]EFA82303.1 prespore-specific protein [Heterostelium album PN500]|eukprot:XP_020434420.1 prespore-specific protein [Heterostelium album PN500]